LGESEPEKSRLAKLTAISLILLLTVGGFGLFSVFTPAASASTPTFTFSNYELSRSGDSTHAGVSCPNTLGNCWNWNAEPNLATAPDGTVYVSSENAAFNHPSECNDAAGGTAAQTLYICGGTGAWKSLDGGRHFSSLTSPNTNFATGNAVTLWGGDTHVATATARNSQGQYNVYVVSLETSGSGLIGVEESTSQDGGKTWSSTPFTIQAPEPVVNPLANPLVEDRPWVGAIGAHEVCVSVHEGGAVGDVWCSYNDGLTFTQLGTIFDATHGYLIAETSIPGALHIDHRTGTMYVPFSGVGSASEAVPDTPCGSLTGVPCPYGNHVVYMAVSTDGGVTFTDHQVYFNADNQVSYGWQFLSMAIDQGGNVYEAFSDGVNLYYSYSRDQGQTWHGPYGVNKAPSNWAIEPWLTAGSPGKIDIVWYGSENCGTGITDVDKCQDTANWHVFFAQNLDVFSSPTSFSQVDVTGVIHLGPVCSNGSSCQSYRGLFDDFGITSDPRTGMANIVYDNDMFTPNNPNNLPNPDCKSQYSTPTDPAQQTCVHTNIAHQTSGPGVFRKHSFEIGDEGLKEESDREHADYRNSVHNDGEASITSISVSFAGVAIPLTFNSTFPLQPGGTISSTSVVSLQTITLLLGTAYPTVVTATFDDGTTLSLPSSVVLSSA
jgi:hypothetical protein